MPTKYTSDKGRKVKVINSIIKNIIRLYCAALRCYGICDKGVTYREALKNTIPKIKDSARDRLNLDASQTISTKTSNAIKIPMITSSTRGSSQIVRSDEIAK